MTSILASYHPLAAAMKAIQEKLDLNAANWTAANAQQALFLKRLPRLVSEAEYIAGIKTGIGRDAATINKWLSKHDFTVTFKEFGPSELGLASILDHSCTFIRHGIATTIVGPENRLYDAVRLTSGLSFTRAAGHPFPIVQIQGLYDSWTVITQFHEELHGSTLIDRASLILGARQPASKEHTSLVLPMIDVSIQADVRWMHGLSIGGYVLKQAMQEDMLRLNQYGGNRTSIARDSEPLTAAQMQRQLVFDDQFLLIAGSGCGPDESRFLVAVIDCEAWSNPGNFNTLISASYRDPE